MTSRLILFDTSNYIDFPIGGQITSISNFLLFLTQKHASECQNVILVGVTTNLDELGIWQKIQINGITLSMLPVAVANTDLSHIQKSLRLQFAKGLLKYGRQLHITKRDCCYIHTPEAYGVVKLLNPFATCVIFSHGSYFNMEQSFRFFQKNVLIKKGFMLYIKWIIRNAKLIFVLDDDSYHAYDKYNHHLIKALNSIVCPSEKESHDPTGNLIFVGRLSKGKNIGPIIDAVRNMDNRRLLIVGDGEEYDSLSSFASSNIQFAGAVPPSQIKEYMKQSDILIMNSLFEGIPMTILEALSFGLPVITTPVGGIPSVLHFGQDSEETDGTAGQIREKIEKIYASYASYSECAYQNSKRFDYLEVNRTIYHALKRLWK